MNYLEYFADSVEQPTVRVDLLLVLRLDDEDERDGDEVVGVFALRYDQLWGSIHRQLGCILGN